VVAFTAADEVDVAAAGLVDAAVGVKVQVTSGLKDSSGKDIRVYDVHKFGVAFVQPFVSRSGHE
jgi:hypothetical protein